MSQTKVSQHEHRDPPSHVTVGRRTAVRAVDCNSQVFSVSEK